MIVLQSLIPELHKALKIGFGVFVWVFFCEVYLVSCDKLILGAKLDLN